MRGAIELADVTEKQFEQILQYKVAHEGKFIFDPTKAKTSPNAAQPSGVLYFGVNIGWTTDDQMKIVLDLVSSLLS